MNSATYILPPNTAARPPKLWWVKINQSQPIALQGPNQARVQVYSSGLWRSMIEIAPQLSPRRDDLVSRFLWPSIDSPLVI